MSVIYATRQGFSFQDKYATLLFLRELRNGTLRKIYTDFPFGDGNKSLDILIVVGDTPEATEERAYEVKTGKKFKSDARTLKLSEVKDAVKSFIEYSIISANHKGFITFTTGSARTLEQYLGPAAILFRSGRLDATARSEADRLIALLGNVSELQSQQSCYDFFKRIQFEALPYSNTEIWSRVDEHISSEISSIARDLGADAQADVLPNGYLVASLCSVAQKYSGTSEDAATHFIKEVAEFMTLRKMLASYIPGGSPAQSRAQADTQVRAALVSNYKVQDLLPQSPSDIPATSDATGGQIHV